jgi:hypothetical protein
MRKFKPSICIARTGRQTIIYRSVEVDVHPHVQCSALCSLLIAALGYKAQSTGINEWPRGCTGASAEASRVREKGDVGSAAARQTIAAAVFVDVAVAGKIAIGVINLQIWNLRTTPTFSVVLCTSEDVPCISARCNAHFVGGSARS